MLKYCAPAESTPSMYLFFFFSNVSDTCLKQIWFVALNGRRPARTATSLGELKAASEDSEDQESRAQSVVCEELAKCTNTLEYGILH